jgi:hypothetical protein
MSKVVNAFLYADMCLTEEALIVNNMHPCIIHLCGHFITPIRTTLCIHTTHIITLNSPEMPQLQPLILMTRLVVTACRTRRVEKITKEPTATTYAELMCGH